MTENFLTILLNFSSKSALLELGVGRTSLVIGQIGHVISRTRLLSLGVCLVFTNTVEHKKKTTFCYLAFMLALVLIVALGGFTITPVCVCACVASDNQAETYNLLPNNIGHTLTPFDIFWEKKRMRTQDCITQPYQIITLEQSENAY